MQSKTIVVGYLFRSIRMTQMENIDNAKCWQGCGATVTIILLTGMQSSTAILESILAVLYEIKYSFNLGPSNTNTRTMKALFI